jgi:hypothetical protein
MRSFQIEIGEEPVDRVDRIDWQIGHHAAEPYLTMVGLCAYRIARH